MKLGACGLIVLGVASLATAQTADAPRVEGNVTVAPFAWPSWGGRATVVAAGAEIFLVEGLSAGGEVGPVIARIPTPGYYYVLGLGSANLSYHFLRSTPTERIKPFLTGGYSTTFRAGIQSGANVGGGIDVVLKPRVSLRLEFREYLSRLRVDHVGPRVGIAFH